MKVNISGKGVIPVVNRVAPVMNIDVDEYVIKKILKFPKFRIFNADGSGQITLATFDQPAAEEKVIEKPVIEKAPKVEEVVGVVTDIVVEEKADVVEETLPEITEQEIVDGEIIEEPTPVEEVPEEEECIIPVEDTDFEEFPAEEAPVEDVAVEEAPKQQTSNKKKKKNRR